MTAVPANETYWLMKIGSVAAVLGAVCAGVGNLLHPITPRDDPHGVASVIVRSELWTLIHLLIVVGTMLMLAGLLAIRHSMGREGVTGALTRLAMYAATIGTTLGVVTVILDGVAAKQLADQWAAAPESGKAVALAVVSANETINFALAGLFNLSFAGVPFVLFGLAVARSATYPLWLGWVAFGAGRIDRSRTRPGPHRQADGGLIDPHHHRPRDRALAARDGVLLWRRSRDLNH
jgi:hypothetical protein